MGQGGSKLFRVDVADKVDPRVAGRAGQKGTLFRYIPAVGDCTVLIKQDDGFSTNWTPISGTAALPTAVSVASVANVNIAVAPATIDGVAYTTALLKDQALPAENGVYDFNGAGNPLTRSAGWDEAAEFEPGREVFVQDGNTQADTLWINELAVTVLGVDPVEFQEIPNASFMLKDFSNSTPAVKDQDFGNFKLINVVLVDASFVVQNSVVATKLLKLDLTGSAAATQITIASAVTAGRTITIPDISGTVLVSDAATGQVYVNASTTLHASNAGMQMNSATSNRGSYRANQYGNNAGVPNLACFKSRGATIGSLASVLAGDTLFRVFGLGVAGDGVTIPQAGMMNILVAAGGVFPAYLATEFNLQLTNLAGALAIKLKMSSEGVLTLPGYGAGFLQTDGAGVVSTGPLPSLQIRLIAAAAAISATTDSAVVCDTTGASGNLTLPAGTAGLEFVFTSAGAGAAVYTLVPNGGDVLDVSVVSIIGAGVVSRIKFLGGTWYAV